MKKINWSVVNFLLLVILIGVGVFFITKKDTKPMVKKPVETVLPEVYRGQMEYVEGEVEKRTDEKDGWRSIEKGDLVKTGDEVRTLVDSRAIVTFEDGSILRLDENTSTRITLAEDNIKVDLNKGGIFNKVSKDEKRKYVVESGEFRMVALGTEFAVERESETVAKVTVLESEVEVQDKTGKKLENVTTGEKAEVSEKEVKKSKVLLADKKDDFLAWNIEANKKEVETKVEEDKKKEVVKEEEKKEEKKVEEKQEEKKPEVKEEKPAEPKKEEDKKEAAPSSTARIGLSGVPTAGGVKVSWTVSGVDVSHGFKLVKSIEPNPVYPGNTYKYFSDSSKRSFEWGIKDGKTYHFRVCAYQGGGKCGLYSNDKVLRAPLVVKDDNKDDSKDKDSEKDEKENKDNAVNFSKNISLSVAKTNTHVVLTWKVKGGETPKGFKAIYSTEPNPVYPGDTYLYLSGSDTRSAKWPLEKFEEGKTYHFRACVYKGSGVCGAYSNDVALEL